MVLGGRWTGLALCALAALLLAGPAGAKIVEFEATLRAGLGDGGDPFPNPKNRTAKSANGLPGCQMGAITHLNASVPAQGFVNVTSGPAPQAIEPVYPFKNGGPGPTTSMPLPNATNTGAGVTMTFGMPGVAGVNGAATWTSLTCRLEFTPNMLPQILLARTQNSFARWPAETTFRYESVITGGGANVSRNVLGTAPEVHRLSAGGGPGNFSVVNNPPGVVQQIIGVSGPNRFGGGFRATGGGKVTIKLPGGLGGAGTGFTGMWTSGPRFAAHNRKQRQSTAPASPSKWITQVLSQTGTFMQVSNGATIPLFLKAWLMPVTTGNVTLFDNGGTFTTNRMLTGYDNRTALGEMGTLLLVSPWFANITGAGAPIYFGGTVESTITFLPEPGPTAAFAGAVLLVLGLHVAARRRSR